VRLTQLSAASSDDGHSMYHTQSILYHNSDNSQLITHGHGLLSAVNNTVLQKKRWEHRTFKTWSNQQAH